MGYKLVLVAHCFANTIYSKRSLTKISQFSAISVAYFANFLQTIRMGRIAKSSTVQVIEGVYLKPSARSPYWQTYFHVDGKTFRKSTKRKELEQAKHVALEQYYDFRRNLADGVLPGSVGFQKLMDVYLQYIEHEGKHAYHSATAKRHFLPFFKNVKDITRITLADVTRYIEHRRNKNESPPLPQTLNRENTVLRQIFAHAVKQGWLREAVKIENLSERLHRRRRRHFTLEEYRQLHRTARKRIAEVEGNPLRTYTYRQRCLLYDYIMYLANSGMRVDEAKTLIWRNVDFEQGHVILEHAGKLRSSRRVILRQTGVRALKRIRQRREEWLDGNDIAEPISANEPVFVLPDGKQVKNFKKGFTSLLEACGFQYDDKNRKHTLTSLRHSYATFSLTRKWGKRAGMRALTIQLGTSEKMIQRNYGHDTITDYEDELRG